MTFTRDKVRNAFDSSLPTDVTAVSVPQVPPVVILVTAFMSHQDACIEAGMHTD